MTDKTMQTLPIDDRGLLLGDGLFATLRAVGGQLLDFDAHYQRLIEGCEALSLPLIAGDDMRRVCHEALSLFDASDPQASDLIVRFTLTAGSGGRGIVRPEKLQLRAFARAFARPSPPAGVSLTIASIRRNEYSPTSRHKTLNYLDNILARETALRKGFDDALMLNTKGEIACVTVGNIFWFEDGRLITPALDCGVRDGVMRMNVMKAARRLRLDVNETFHTLRLSDLDAEKPSPVFAPLRPSNQIIGPFAGAFICNSVMGVVPVTRIGALIPAAHPSIQVLRQALTDRT